MAISTAQMISTPVTSAIVAVPNISPRTVLTTCVTGLMLTTVCSHDGMVSGLTKILLAKVSGNEAIPLTAWTASGVFMTKPTAVQIHDRLKANASSTTTESSTPGTP